jgi:hypothetical protein
LRYKTNLGLFGRLRKQSSQEKQSKQGDQIVRIFAQWAIIKSFQEKYG